MDEWLGQPNRLLLREFQQSSLKHIPQSVAGKRIIRHDMCRLRESASALGFHCDEARAPLR
jgi:hypothetical protein